MNFLSPHFLWLLPLLAVPVIIHLLNLIRYRRLRWAAIEFLLTSEQHIVRRARLKQILLMLLRVGALAAILFALAAPLVGGGLAALLGTRADSLAVLVDSSMSMTTVGIGGTVLDRAKREAADLLASLPHGTAVAAAGFTRSWNCPFGEPVADPKGAANFLAALKPTACGTNVPAALANAAELIKKSKRDGAICVLTDLRASGWFASNDALWESLRARLEEANVKRIVVVDCNSSPVAFNASVTAVVPEPPILLPDRRVSLEVTIAWTGRMPEGLTATLYLDGKRIDSRLIEPADETSDVQKAQCTFPLPPLTAEAQTGYVEIPADGLIADNRFYFLLRPADAVPVLVVEGPAIKASGAKPSEFISRALSPGGKGLFATTVISSSAVSGEALSGNKAVFFADVDRLSDEAVADLKSYLADGGLAFFFLGPNLDVKWWNSLVAGPDSTAAGLAPFAVTASRKTDSDKPFRLGWADVRSPTTERLEKEGMGLAQILRYFRAKPTADAQMLVALENSDPYLCSLQVGRGRVLAIVTSCHEEDSNLPFMWFFPPLIHRLLYDHLGTDFGALAHQAEDEIRVKLAGAPFVEIIYPGGEVARAGATEADSPQAIFTDSKQAGFYRVRAPGQETEGLLLAAVNPPADEVNLKALDADEVYRLLDGFDVNVISPTARSGGKEPGGTPSRAALSFFLAALALAFLVGESVLAWSMGRADSAKSSQEANRT